MEALHRSEQAPLSTPWPRDETHESAVRIIRERAEKMLRLHEVAQRSRQRVSHELHVSIGE